MIKRKIRIAVFGGRKISAELYQQTQQLGVLLARENWLVFCGGGSGAMEAVSRGVSEAGGTCVGILKGRDQAEANPWVTIPVLTDLGISRNALIAYNCDAAISVNGNYGTLSEIAYALQLGKPVIGLETWDIPQVISAENPADVIAKIKENL